jgi:hypothetical protein
MSENLKFEKINIEPEYLFNLTYTFDGLTRFLGQFNRNQEKIIQRLEQLEETQKNLQNQTAKIAEAQTTTNYSMNTLLSPESMKKPFKKELKKKTSDEILNEMGVPESLIINENVDLEGKVKILEKRLNKIHIFIPRIPSDTSKNLLDILDDIKMTLKNLNDKGLERDNFEKNTKNELEELKIKINDFKIYDIFKDAKITGGTLDVSKVLIQNLETKIFKKLGFQDERFKKNEEDIFKNKNDILNFKGISEQQIRTVNNLKESFEKNSKDVENIKSDYQENLNKFKEFINKSNTELNEKINKFKNELKNTDNKITSLDEFSPIKKDNPLSANNGSDSDINSISNKEFKRFKEITSKKISILDSKVYELSKLENKFKPITNELDEIKIRINTKASLQEIYNIRETIDSIKLDIEKLKDIEDELSDDTKHLKININEFAKKLQTLITQNYSFKKKNKNNINNNIDDDDNTGVLTNKILKLTLENYLNLTDFYNFKKEYDKNFERLKHEMDTFKNSYYEILDSLKDKVNENEIKSLEDYLVGLIEETKDRSTKLYAKRIDVNKNIKTLELQIKEIIEVYVKKLDTGDNWILAKKPINSYTCASCEAYLGNLNKKNDDYFENKDYEKINNIGNGFSRILNLININNDVDYRSNKNKINDMNLTGNLINNNNNNNVNEKTKILTDYNSKKEYESDVENINKKTNIKKKKFHHYIQSQALGNSNIQYFKEKPKIKIEANNNENGVLSDDDRKNKKQNNKEDLIKKNIDGPKVMKIIKKTKN